MICYDLCKIYNVWWFIWLAVIGGSVISKANSVHKNYLNTIEWQLILAVFTKMHNINLMLVGYLIMYKYKYHCVKPFKFINVLLFSKSLRHIFSIQYAIFNIQEMFSSCSKHMMILNWRIM